MTDRPIIFSAPMVRALLGGRKTQTRRVLKHPLKIDIGLAPSVQTDNPVWIQFDHPKGGPLTCVRWPYAIGDRLWVREGWQHWPPNNILAEPKRPRIYRATDAEPPASEIPDWAWRGDHKFRWHSPIHMPRWASRLTLTVTDVRVQRLQDISEEDAMAEGIHRNTSSWFPIPGVDGSGTTARAAFAGLWNSIHGPDAWNTNPWVTAITFDVKHRNIDTEEAAS